MKPDSILPVKSEVILEPLPVADQRDDVPMEVDGRITSQKAKPNIAVIPNFQEKENLVNIESTIQEENVTTVQNISKSPPQVIAPQVQSNNLQLTVNQRVHEEKENVLKTDSVEPLKSEVSFEPLTVSNQLENITLEVDKSIKDSQSQPSCNAAKLDIQEETNLVNIESTSQEENVSVNKIQRSVPQEITPQVESENTQISVNQQVPLEIETISVETSQQEIGTARESMKIEAPTEISKVDSEEKEMKINSQVIKKPTAFKGKISENLNFKVTKEVSINDAGEKEEKIKSSEEMPKSIQGILKPQLEQNSKADLSQTKCEVHQPIKRVLQENFNSKQDITVDDASAEDQPRWTSSEESLPDLDMDTSNIPVLNEDLVSKIKSISNVIAESISPGISVQEVTAHLSSEDEKILKKPETQVALFNAAQRMHDKPKIIKDQVVREISQDNQNTETFGTRALLLANEMASGTHQNVTSFFELKDFDCSKTRKTLCDILNNAQDLKIKKSQPKMNISKSNEEKYKKAIKSLVVESNEGKPVNEIISEKHPKDVENMQCIESQMAMLSVVEKLGHEKVTEDVVLEHLNSDRVGMLNIVGTKALMSVLKDKPYSTEEIMIQFKPDDFQHEKVQERVTKILNVAKAVNQKVENGTHH